MGWISLNAPWFILLSFIYYAFMTNLTTTYEDSFRVSLWSISNWLAIYRWSHLFFAKWIFFEREYQTAQIIFSEQKPFGLQMEKYLKTSIRNDSILLLDETFCAIWFYLLKPATLLKVTLFHGGLSRILNCTKVTKSRKSSHILCV